MASHVIRFFLWVTGIVFLVGFFSACSIPTKQPSLYDTQPDLLSNQYTPDEIMAIEHGFETNPSQYSQELGNMMIWRIHQKCPEFALEFAQTPDLNDRIDVEEATAMVSIYTLIKGLDIPLGFFKETGQGDDIYKIVMKWNGNSEKKSDWSGYFRYSYIGILDVKPIGFEPGEDEFDHKSWSRKGCPKWKSKVDARDTDGIVLTLRFQYITPILFVINNQILGFSEKDFLSQNQLTLTKGQDGNLTIENISETTETNHSPELYALRDMVMAGENDYRYSAPLQALLWGYMDGKFKEDDNPFENYVDIVGFVKPIWGKMEGQRWKDFNTVVDRLNAPELIDYYEKQNLSYEYYRGDWKTNKSVFKSKLANCKDITQFSVECLRRAGYKAGDLLVAVGEGHNICYYWDKGKLFIIDNANPKRGILGPYNSFKEIPYFIEEFL